jgi:hypothetical protein
MKVQEESHMRWIKAAALLIVILVGGTIAALVLSRQTALGASVQSAVSSAFRSIAQRDGGGEAQVQSAVDGVLQAFDSYSVVAIGDEHGLQQLGDFYQTLLRHPDFAKKVDALVVEYGNARYQALVDRYVSGEDVAAEDLQKVWSDAVGKIPGGTEVMYPQLFAAVRAVNQSLPDDQKLRILLGDPPIDWSQVQDRSDVEPFQAQRDSHFAQVVTDEVLDQGLKALVIIGGTHLDRSQSTNALQTAGGEGADQLQPLPGASGAAAPQGEPQMRELPQSGTNADGPPAGQPEMRQLPLSGTSGQPQSAGGKAQLMQQIVEAKYPGRTFVILVHTGFADDQCNAQAEQRMAAWQTPALALVEGSWLETIDCPKFPGTVLVRRSGGPVSNPAGPDATGNQSPGAAEQPQMRTLPTQPGQSSPLSEADGYLYLGPRDSLMLSPLDPIIYLDQEFFAEQSRRRELMSGEPLIWEQVAASNVGRFVDKYKR